MWIDPRNLSTSSALYGRVMPAQRGLFCQSCVRFGLFSFLMISVFLSPASTHQLPPVLKNRHLFAIGTQMQNLQAWQPDPLALNGTADEHYRIPLNSRPWDPGNCSSAVSGRPHGLQPG